MATNLTSSEPSLLLTVFERRPFSISGTNKTTGQSGTMNSGPERIAPASCSIARRACPALRGEVGLMRTKSSRTDRIIGPPVTPMCHGNPA
jgi:hypothetical protein